MIIITVLENITRTYQNNSNTKHISPKNKIIVLLQNNILLYTFLGRNVILHQNNMHIFLKNTF